MFSHFRGFRVAGTRIDHAGIGTLAQGCRRRKRAAGVAHGLIPRCALGGNAIAPAVEGFALLLEILDEHGGLALVPFRAVQQADQARTQEIKARSEGLVALPAVAQLDAHQFGETLDGEAETLVIGFRALKHDTENFGCAIKVFGQTFIRGPANLHNGVTQLIGGFRQRVETQFGIGGRITHALVRI